MMVIDLDEVTFDAELDGEEVRRTLARRVWERRGWATVAAAYEERARDGSWRPHLAIIRFRRHGEGWKKHAQVTLPGEQARGLGHLVEALGEQVAADDHDDDVS